MTYNERLVKISGKFCWVAKGDRIFAHMKKDTRLTFRVSSDVKRNIEAIAVSEGRSAGQICEAFLKAGSETYKKRGTKFLQRFFTKTT
jgi:hypothetical protein